ncbi:MAG TPA: hypothetical protein VF297_03320 [Pyrinomonadaceae bacterium]
MLVLVLAAIGYVVYLLAIGKPEPPPKPQWPRRYAGIEIGTRAMRYAIVKISRNDGDFEYELEGRPGSAEFDVKFDRDGRIVNTDELKGIIRNVVEEQIIPAKVPAQDIHIIAGSSYKNSSNLDEVLKDLKTAYPASTVSFLDETTESLVELKTLVNPPAELNQILLIGVGSQTTKIAAYGGKKHVFAKPFDIGVRKLAQDVADAQQAALAHGSDRQPASPAGKVEELKRLQEAARRILSSGREASKMGKVLTENPFRSMRATIITGGLPCVLLQSIGELKVAEFAGGPAVTANNSDRYTLIQQEELTRFRKFAEEKFTSGHEGDKLCGDFTREELVVGAELMQILYEKSSFENKPMFHFDRLTWIPGYFVYQAEKAN